MQTMGSSVKTNRALPKVDASKNLYKDREITNFTK